MGDRRVILYVPDEPAALDEAVEVARLHMAPDAPVACAYLRRPSGRVWQAHRHQGGTVTVRRGGSRG